MRLICPNCSAQYEIDASLIPDEGRDVQCSNCGHTWFELAPDQEAESPIRLEEENAAVAETQDAEASAEPEAEEEADDAPQDPSDNDDVEEPSRAARAIAAATRDLDDEELDEEEVFGTLARPKRPAVDRAALEVLKEEATREMAQRRAAPTIPLETQTDLGIDELKDQTPSRALKARMARVTGEERQSALAPSPDESKPIQEEYQAPRKDLLPDIDEINSSLRPGSDEAEADEATRRRGFRLGFGLMLVATALLIFAYAYAPSLAVAFPASEPALLGYVDWANGVRDWLDGLLG